MPPVTVAWDRFRAVLLDLDGVITPTAEIHERAWGELFADQHFTSADYLAYIDGKNRYEGVRSFLESRGLSLPYGDPTDPPGDGSICALGNRKNDMFNRIVDSEPVAPYPGTVAVLDLLDELGTLQAVVSSSRNARAVLAAAGMGGRFEVVVDGMVAAAEGLASKPAPDGFLLAAALLQIEPADAAVVEDAVAGVAAGVAGHFGFVLGVNRGGNAEALAGAGANLVVSDLSQTLPIGQALPVGRVLAQTEKGLA
jgi:HAD superfamily hydrolase (TIGR01509 family)